MNPCMGAIHSKAFIYRMLRCIHAFIHQGRLTRNDQRCLCVGFKWSGRKTSASNPKDPTCALTHSLLRKKKDCLCQRPAAGTDWVTECYWELTVNPVASDQRPTCGCDQQRDVVEARHTAVITGRLVCQVVCLQGGQIIHNFSPLNMVLVLNMALNMAISYFSYTNGMWPQLKCTIFTNWSIRSEVLGLSLNPFLVTSYDADVCKVSTDTICR